MSPWKKFHLRDIISIKHGYAFKGDFFSEEPTKDILLTPGNFAIGGGFKSEKLKYYSGPVPEDYVLGEQDIIITMTDLSKEGDTLGYSAKVPFSSCDERYLHNQRLGRVSLINQNFDIEFIYWVMRTIPYQRFIASSASGATVRHTSPSRIGAYTFRAPDLPTQRKIASILSAYDDLIENNLKRISLLEELAQITYEEWFVRMRFPGHEHTPIDQETGLPEGWKRTTLGKSCLLTMGQSPKSEYYNQEGIGVPFHQGVRKFGQRFPENDTWSTVGNRIAENGDILFSVRAPVGRLNMALETMVLGRGLAGIRHKKGWNAFVYYQLKQIFFKEDMMGGGAIFNSVTKHDVQGIGIIEGDQRVMREANNLFEPINALILNLTIQNRNLREARDILLPRLMTGMIDVNEIQVQPKTATV